MARGALTSPQRKGVSRQVAFTPLAASDIRQAFEWYDAQRSGLGEEFTVAVDRILALVQEMPELGPIVHRDVRRILLVRFPYAIYYRVTEIIEVRACLHLRRAPGVWQRRG